jgi:hypothetical protein
MSTSLQRPSGAVRLCSFGTLLRYAGIAGGVRSIVVKSLYDGVRGKDAHVTINYDNGAVGRTYFVDASHAMDWANARRKLSAARSWWHGCDLKFSAVAKGEWDYVNHKEKQA